MPPPNLGTRWNTLVDRWRDRMTADPEQPQGSTRQRNGIAIAVCILISFLLWFTFNMRDSYTVVIEMPTRVTNLPEGQALEEMPPSQVRVQVHGEGWQLLQLYYSPQSLPIDASIREVDLMDATPVLPRLPGGVTIQGISPRFIQVETGPRVTRRLPVEPRVTIATVPGYDLVSPYRIRPDSVWVTGARGLLMRLRSWPTQHFVREQVRNSFTVSVPLSDTLAGLVSRDMEETVLMVDVEQFTEGMREISIIVEGEPTDETRVRLMPERVNVRYQVPLSQYEQAQMTDDFYATVSYEQILEDETGSIAPSLRSPDHLIVRNVLFEPRQLRYTLIVPPQ